MNLSSIGNLNPLQLLQAKNNPKQFAQNIINSNPNFKDADKIAKAIDLYNSNDNNGLQELAKEICSAQGTSSDMVGSYIRNRLGL